MLTLIGGYSIHETYAPYSNGTRRLHATPYSRRYVTAPTGYTNAWDSPGFAGMSSIHARSRTSMPSMTSNATAHTASASRRRPQKRRSRIAIGEAPTQAGTRQNHTTA